MRTIQSATTSAILGMAFALVGVDAVAMSHAGPAGPKPGEVKTEAKAELKAEPKADVKSEAKPAAGRLAKGEKVGKVEKADKTDVIITEPAELVTNTSTINPLTGKLMSEELLQRQLSVAKLRTALRQEEIKIKQLERTDQIEADRLKSDRLKATLEATAAAKELLSPQNDQVRRNRTVRTRVEVPPPPPAEPVAVAPVAPPVMVPPPPPPPVATGTIRIGEETLRPNARYEGIDARVSFVDEQKSASNGPGAAAPSFTGPQGSLAGAIIVPAGTQPPGLPSVGQPLRTNSIPAMPSPIFPPR